MSVTPSEALEQADDGQTLIDQFTATFEYITQAKARVRRPVHSNMSKAASRTCSISRMLQFACCFDSVVVANLLLRSN